ncbi:MAG: hypothetical protein ACI9Y1_000861 [Lentisphaeria bacterium]|jgi:hypothetical protein
MRLAQQTHYPCQASKQASKKVGGNLVVLHAKEGRKADGAQNQQIVALTTSTILRAPLP